MFVFIFICYIFKSCQSGFYEMYAYLKVFSENYNIYWAITKCTDKQQKV